MTKKRATTELILAGALWGFGFIATKWALDSYTVYELLTYRFFLAAIAGELILAFLHFRKKSKGLFTASQIKTDIKMTFWAGLLMALFIIPQTIGLETTTATKSGFLTVLYILLVPMIHHLFFKHFLPKKVYAAAAFGLFGVALLVDLFKEKTLVVGDAWTLVCALFAALHITYVGFVAIKSRSPFRFNNFQSIWCCLFILPFLVGQESIHLKSDHTLAIAGVLFMAFGSSLMAFTIQVRAQQVLSSTTTSMLCLLESPFALLFGFWFLSETLNWAQALGALIILVSSALVVKWEHQPASSTGKTLK